MCPVADEGAITLNTIDNQVLAQIQREKVSAPQSLANVLVARALVDTIDVIDLAAQQERTFPALGRRVRAHTCATHGVLAGKITVGGTGTTNSGGDGTK